MLRSNMESYHKDAKAAAIKQISDWFQNPGQLEKIEQYKRRTTRKQLSTEAMLKTVMQSQLDSVILAINGLETSQEAIHELKCIMDKVNGEYSSLPELGINLQDVKRENMRHSQFVTAKENLKHLFTMPENIEKAKNWIAESKLLHAHQSLNSLENSRDDVLYELHKLPDQPAVNSIQVRTYFEDVELLSQMLEKQLKLILSRTLNTIRKEPARIVTVFRIIEREERVDAIALQRERQNGFLPPGRPKKWREMAFKELERSVQQRIEGTQVEDRSSNKSWLIRYLILLKVFILEDLRVVKTLCGPCFPPSYDIINKFVQMYHRSLSAQLEEIISNGLEGNEYVTMLQWVRITYFGPELMMHPDLNIDITNVGPLLNSRILSDLQQKYLDGMEKNYENWLQKMLENEKKVWNSQVALASTSDDTPIIIFQMIHENLNVAKTIGADATQKVLKMGMDQVKNYGKMYREAIVELKKTHFENRNLIQNFTHHMVTILNYCIKFQELAKDMKEAYQYSEGHILVIPDYDALLNTFQNLRNEIAMFMVEEPLTDLNNYFQDLVTTKWITSNHEVTTICVTLDDYFGDYQKLKEPNFEYVLHLTEDLVAQKYIIAMLQKRITFRQPEERRQAATKIEDEVNQLKEFFAKMTLPTKEVRTDSPMDAVKELTEIIKNEDKEMISLDLQALVNNFADISDDHLTRLLLLRGDLSKSEVRDMVMYVRENAALNDSKRKTIFSQVP